MVHIVPLHTVGAMQPCTSHIESNENSKEHVPELMIRGIKMRCPWEITCKSLIVVDFFAEPLAYNDMNGRHWEHTARVKINRKSCAIQRPVFERGIRENGLQTS
jgi:hypothetical protein